MIFAVQRWLEDHFQRRGLEDPGQYAVQVANTYDAYRASESTDALVRRICRIRTPFFRSNSISDRQGFVATLVGQLDRRFKKKVLALDSGGFPGGLEREARKLRHSRRTIAGTLQAFRAGVQARAVDTIWLSRTQLKLRARPERITQGLLEMFLKGVTRTGGFSLSEIGSGVGYMDVLVAFGATPHLVELKVLTSSVVGPKQLATYMAQEQRKEGWLVLFDARPHSTPRKVPLCFDVPEGKIRVVHIEMNPIAPSKKK